MKTIDLSKTIGLVRYLDGTYRPSNERSAEKLGVLYRAAGVPQPWRFEIARHELGLLRDLSKTCGYKIVTSIKAVLS